MSPTLERQPAASPRDRLLADYGDNRTLELAMIVRSWHGIGAITTAGPTCKHCLPAAAWPCWAFDLAQKVIVSLTRDEPYGPPAGNEYLRQVLDAEAARAVALERQVRREVRPEMIATAMPVI